MSKRPDVINGTTKAYKTGCGKLYITVNEIDSKPFEVFVEMGKAGGCAKAQNEAQGRLISYIIQNFQYLPDDPILHIIKSLKGITCHNLMGESDKKVLSCSDVIAQRLEELYGKPATE